MNKELKDKVAMLKEAMEKISQVEWYSLCVGTDVYAVFAKSKPEAIVAITHTDEEGTKIGLGKNTAQYIAFANPATVLELIAEIEALEKEADWLAEQLADNVLYQDRTIFNSTSWREEARKAVREG